MSRAYIQSTKIRYKGRVFDSKMEYERFIFLLQCHDIKKLRHHPPPIRAILNGYLLFSYTPDFSYILAGQIVYEDVKSQGSMKVSLIKQLFNFKRKFIYASVGVWIGLVTNVTSQPTMPIPTKREVSLVS